MNRLALLILPLAMMMNIHIYDDTTNTTVVYDKGVPVCSYEGIAPTEEPMHDGTVDVAFDLVSEATRFMDMWDKENPTVEYCVTVLNLC